MRRSFDRLIATLTRRSADRRPVAASSALWQAPPVPGEILIDSFADDGYRLRDDGWEHVTTMPEDALELHSGATVIYTGSPLGVRSTLDPSFGWRIAGRSEAGKVAVWTFSTWTKVVYAAVDLRTLLVENPRLLRRQPLLHDGQAWRVGEVNGEMVELVGSDAAIRVDATTLIDENFAELRDRCVVLVDKG